MPVFSAIIGANASKKAARAQENASNKALALQKEQFDQTRADLAPYRAVGAPALTAYMNSIGLGGEAGKASSLSMFRDTNPGYNFQLQEGTRARDYSAAARGALGSGGYAKELTAFGQGLADSTYGTWQDRLNGLVTTGQNAAAQTGTFAQNYANAGGQLIQDAGNARASGIMGAANAYMGGIGQLAQLAGNAFGFGGGGSGWRG